MIILILLSGLFLLEEPKALRELFTASHQIEEVLGVQVSRAPAGANGFQSIPPLAGDQASLTGDFVLLAGL